MLRHRYPQLLAHYLAPLRWSVVLLMALLLGSIGLQLASPQILRSFIDATQSGAARSALTWAAVLYLGVETARRAAALGASFLGASVGGIATNALRADLLGHCLLLDMPFHQRHTPGELVERLSGDVGALANFFSQFAIRLLGSALLVLGILVMLFRENWRVGAGLTVYAPLTFVALRVIHPLAVRRRAAARVALPDGPLAMAFERVSFQYDDRPAQGAGEGEADDGADGAAVLHDLSFTLDPGKVLGLLGRTGSGKTTLTRLLFRLYDPTEGSVRLAGADLRDLPLADVRRRVALVTQDVQLFHSTVRDNVALFDPSVPDERIVAALDEAALAAWYRALPHGLDTLLGPGGQGLSAGEVQLLAFARVFLKDPAGAMLDEASARLDPATERRLARATDRLLGRGGAGWGVEPSARTRTGIVIAHRLQTVCRVDDILILEEDRVREHGRREALEQDPTSRYVALLRGGLEEVLERADSPAAAMEVRA